MFIPLRGTARQKKIFWPIFCAVIAISAYVLWYVVAHP